MTEQTPFTIEQFYKFLAEGKLMAENAQNAEKSTSPPDLSATTATVKPSHGYACLPEAHSSPTQSYTWHQNNSSTLHPTLSVSYNSKMAPNFLV